MLTQRQVIRILKGQALGLPFRVELGSPTHLGDPSITGPENDEAARAAFKNTAVGFSVEVQVSLTVPQARRSYTLES